MDSSRLRAFVVVGVCGVGLTGCADPCLDDGLGQTDCPTESTEGDTDESSGSASDSSSTSASSSITDSDSTSDSDSADSTDASATADDTNSATDTNSADASDGSSDGSSDPSSDGGGALWCADADGDGFGDPDDCTNTDDPPGGTVDNDDDCDDDDDHTFPGAAENEPNGGDAECMSDADEDGWGDADPGGDDTIAGADCYDGNVALNPDTMALSTFVSAFGGAYIVEVNEDDASLGDSIPVDPSTFNWDPVSATIAEDGTLVVNNNSGDRLWVVDWAGYCAGDTASAEAEPLPMPNGSDVFCGIAFGPDGVLYGVESETDTIAVMDPSTGAVVSSIPVVLDGNPYDVGSCGMTFDCHTQQLVFASGFEGAIYSIDPATGALDFIADIDGTWSPTGLGYEPVERVVYLSADTELYRVALDGSSVEDVGSFSFGFGDVTVPNLDEMPICSP